MCIICWRLAPITKLFCQSTIFSVISINTSNLTFSLFSLTWYSSSIYTIQLYILKFSAYVSNLLKRRRSNSPNKTECDITSETDNSKRSKISGNPKNSFLLDSDNELSIDSLSGKHFEAIYILVLD